MRLSIITINYNNLQGLIKTVDSVLLQTFHDFEWIIIDGGSTDGSKEYIEQLAKDLATRNWLTHKFSLSCYSADDNVKENFNFFIPDTSASVRSLYWCSEPDKGIYNAMNKGITIAHGDYLNFMNSGDSYHEKETLISVFSSLIPINAGVVYCNYYDISNDGKVLPQILPEELDFAFLMKRPINHQSTFIKKDLFSNYKYDEKYKIVADGKAFMKWMIEGVCFYHLDVFVADFYMGGIHNQEPDLINLERQKIIEECIPKGIYNVASQLEEQKLIWEEYPYLKDTLDIYKRHKFKRKLITLLIKILKC